MAEHSKDKNEIGQFTADVGLPPPSLNKRSRLILKYYPLFCFALLTLAIFFIKPKQTPYNGPMIVAHQLLEGRPYLPEKFSWMETFERNGRAYNAYPPMVTLLLVPYALLGGADQTLYCALLVILSAALIYWLIRSLVGTNCPAVLGMVCYVLGSSTWHSVAVGDVWSMMHLQGNIFLLAALCLAVRGGSNFAVGFCWAIAACCRHTLLFSVVAFVVLAWRSTGESENRTSRILRVGVSFCLGASFPVLATVIMQWWTTGHPLLSPYTVVFQQWKQTIPTFSTDYVWKNLVFYFTAHPTLTNRFPFLSFSLAGQSILIMSPWVFGIVCARFRNAAIGGMALAALASFSFYQFYYWNGAAQLGSRYLQDIYPFLIPVAFSGFNGNRRKQNWFFAVTTAWAVVMNVGGNWIYMR